jgi:hypothetical protein
VSCCVVMFVLREVGRQLGVYNAAERHKPECEAHHCKLSNTSVHRPLSKSRCHSRPLFLNPRDGVIDLLFGQQSALDIFLYAPLLIDEDAHR